MIEEKRNISTTIFIVAFLLQYFSIGVISVLVILHSVLLHVHPLFASPYRDKAVQIVLEWKV